MPPAQPSLFGGGVIVLMETGSRFDRREVTEVASTTLPKRLLSTWLACIGISSPQDSTIASPCCLKMELERFSGSRFDRHATSGKS